MTPEQRAAYVIAQAVYAFAEIEGMKIANKEREQAGESPAYNEKAFRDVPVAFGLGHNAVVMLFRQ